MAGLLFFVAELGVAANLSVLKLMGCKDVSR